MVFLKVDRGGEDAFFVSNYNGGVISVADGVSGYATFTIIKQTQHNTPNKNFNFVLIIY